MGDKVTLLLSIIGLLLFSAARTMGAIHDDYAKLEYDRKNIELQREKFENAVSALEEQRRLVENYHFKCSCGRWRILWKKRVDEANTARKELEIENDNLKSLNRILRELNDQLECNRREIESKHIVKDYGYENELRAWMNRLETEYFFRLKNELFEGYREYISGMNNYYVFVNSSAEQCKNKEYGEAALELAEGHITDILKAIKDIKDIFSKGR